MHELVLTLDRMGLIERPASADRRHVRLLRLTEAGREKLTACVADVDRIERQMLSDLTPAEVTTLRSLLERCHAALAH
jgi:DNA-binding MarR family transcriptional regulator